LVWLAVVLAAPSIALGQAGIALDARMPNHLGKCVVVSELQTNYVSALRASGTTITGGSLVETVLRTRADDAQPGSTLLILKASLQGRALGQIVLRATVDDCPVITRAIGQAVARLVRQTAAADANRPFLPLQDNALPVHSFSSGATESAAAGDIAVLGIGAGFVGGVLPYAAAALQLLAATTNLPVSFRLRATVLWPQQIVSEQGVIDTASYDLSLEICGTVLLPSWQRLALRLCAGPRIGIEDSRYKDLPLSNKHLTNLFAYVGLAPELALQLASATWLQLGGGIGLAVVRPHILLGIDRQRRNVELSNPATVRTELGLSLLQVF
jgi:hypothetical protein